LDVVRGGESEDRLINLSGQSRLLPLREVVRGNYRFAVRIDERNLFAVELVRRHFQVIAEPISQGHARLQVPRIGYIQVVRGNDALVVGYIADLTQLEVLAGTGVHQ